MQLYNMYYPCKCGTRYVNTVDGDKILTDGMTFHKCPSCGNNVELGDISQVVIRV